MPKPRSRKTPPKPLFHNHQWQQCYDDWLRSVAERSGSKTSPVTYRNMTRRLFRDPRRTPDTYSRSEIEAFVRQSVKKPPSAASQNNRLTILRSFYNYAEQYDVPFRTSMRPILHTRNPTRGMRSVREGRSRRHLSEDELKQLFAAIPRDTVKGKRDYALFSFYFWTARRCSEILRLTWGDIFAVPYVNFNGETYQGHKYRYSTKGHSRETFTAELRPEAWDALIDYLQASGRLETMRPGSPLFVRLDNAKREDTPLLATSIDRILDIYVQEAGIDIPGRQICVHSLRHTRARAQYRRKHDIMEIQALLGHSSVASTQIYLIDVDDKPDTGAAMLAAELGKL